MPRRSAPRAEPSRSAAALGAQTLDPPRPLGPLALTTLGLAALGRQLALELGPPHRQRPLLGRGLALLDQPVRLTLSLHGLREGSARCRAARRRPARARPRPRASAPEPARLPPGRRARPATTVRCRRSDVALVAARQHPLGAAGGDLAHLSPGPEPGPSRARACDALEVRGQILQALDAPRRRRAACEPARGSRPTR